MSISGINATTNKKVHYKMNRHEHKLNRFHNNLATYFTESMA